jgi:mevalonate kinase
MQWESFQTRVPGKWILVGEHSVLRGATAVAMPNSDVALELVFESASEPSASFTVHPPEARLMIEEILSSVAKEGQKFTQPAGQLSICSTIPIGAGVGSSAALCVALTRWMAQPLAIAAGEVLEFATQLEHRFHGRSSGLDVAVVSSQQPVTYVMGRGPEALGIQNLPKFTLHDTQLRGATKECIAQVNHLRERDPKLGLQLDQAMESASAHAVEGLKSFDAGDKKQGLAQLQLAMQKARDCFYSWQLVPSSAKRLEEDLLNQGALAVKLTGAGGGGMVVALWES